MHLFNNLNTNNLPVNPLINTSRFSRLVLGLLFKIDEDDTDVPEFTNFELRELVTDLNIERLYNLYKGFYHYYGSLTTPQ